MIQPVGVAAFCLAECSVIVGEVAEIGARRGRDQADISEMIGLSEKFFRAAIEQARTEGVEDPQLHAAGLCAEKSEEWQERFSSLWKLQENKDWIDHYRALGRSRAILPSRN